MKKIFLIIAALTAFGTAAHAQLHSRSGSYVGLKAGGTAASFIGAYNPNLRTVYGFHAGAFASIALNKPFSIQPELLFSMKGALGQAGVSDGTERLNYIDVPVAFRATWSDLFVEAGPQGGFLLTAKSKNGSETVNVRDTYRTFDFGYLLGVGYQPHQGGLGIGGRYNASFLSVYANPIDGTVANDLRNSAFQLYVTYSAQKGRKPKRKSPR